MRTWRWQGGCGHGREVLLKQDRRSVRHSFKNSVQVVKPGTRLPEAWHSPLTSLQATSLQEAHSRLLKARVIKHGGMWPSTSSSKSTPVRNGANRPVHSRRAPGPAQPRTAK